MAIVITDNRSVWNEADSLTGWGEKGYRGEVEYKGKNGSIELNLGEDQINKMFELFADFLVEASREAADNLTANIIEHKETLKIEKESE